MKDDLIAAIEAADETFGDDDAKFRAFVRRLLHLKRNEAPGFATPRPTSPEGGGAIVRYGVPL